MRPQERIRRIQLAIDNSIRKSSIIPLLKVKREIEVQAIIQYKLDKELCEEYGMIFDPVVYYEDIDFSFNLLSYLSDRWNCYGRLAYLLKIINQYTVKEER